MPFVISFFSWTTICFADRGRRRLLVYIDDFSVTTSTGPWFKKVWSGKTKAERCQRALLTTRLRWMYEEEDSDTVNDFDVYVQFSIMLFFEGFIVLNIWSFDKKKINNR